MEELAKTSVGGSQEAGGGDCAPPVQDPPSVNYNFFFIADYIISTYNTVNGSIQAHDESNVIMSEISETGLTVKSLRCVVTVMSSCACKSCLERVLQ